MTEKESGKEDEGGTLKPSEGIPRIRSSQTRSLLMSADGGGVQTGGEETRRHVEQRHGRLNISLHYGHCLVLQTSIHTRWKRRYYVRSERRGFWMGLIWRIWMSIKKTRSVRG
jgi:hypothetical protein